MELKTIETPWSSITWEDMATLAICLALDLLDYIVPFMATPVYGDILDFTGIVFCMLFFNWVGVVTFLEIIPGTDIIPIFSITWLSWYIIISRVRRKKLEQELEQWK
jgi:hypothetical protein